VRENAPDRLRLLDARDHVQASAAARDACGYELAMKRVDT